MPSRTRAGGPGAQSTDALGKATLTAWPVVPAHEGAVGPEGAQGAEGLAFQQEKRVLSGGVRGRASGSKPVGPETENGAGTPGANEPLPRTTQARLPQALSFPPRKEVDHRL